ncbi:MAG: peptidase S41, partial [Caulobacteraceae bacterium]|nr:peptidase S41 [Caulobacter sp.]
VNGHDLRAPADPDSLLAGRDGEIVLSVAARADGPRREVRVTPLKDDLALRQHDWVEANRARVAALSGGRVGYVFVADFDARGSEDLVRQLQPQLDKQGLVFDVRWNRGGFTSQAVLNLLKRVRAGDFVDREGALEPLPLFAAPRAMATVANAGTASDGDQFAYFFKAFGLGPLVGQRTWGGVQGIKGPWPLMDGASLTIPKDSLASPEGRWLIENEGVTPSLAVDPAPDEDATGRDRLLETAVQAVLDEIAAHPPAPARGPAPLPAYPPGGDVPGARFEAQAGPPSAPAEPPAMEAPAPR